MDADFFPYAMMAIPLEPLHIHVRKAENLTKFWLVPEVPLAYSYGFRASELRALLNVIEQNNNGILEAWNEHFNK